jgi:hypothetical protein
MYRLVPPGTVPLKFSFRTNPLPLESQESVIGSELIILDLLYKTVKYDTCLDSGGCRASRRRDRSGISWRRWAERDRWDSWLARSRWCAGAPVQSGSSLPKGRGPPRAACISPVLPTERNFGRICAFGFILKV